MLVAAPSASTADGSSGRSGARCGHLMQGAPLQLQQAAALQQQQYAPAAAAPGTSSSAQAAQGHLLARRRTKREVASDYVERLAARQDIDVSSLGPSIRQHFECLPTRYALDVNMDGLDVLSHKRLLDEARQDPSAVSFAVRPVEIIVPRPPQQPMAVDAPGSPQTTSRSASGRLRGALPKPAFGSSPNLQVLALEANQERDASGPGAAAAGGMFHTQQSMEELSPHDSEVMTFYEITVASVDQPKLLSRLSEALSDLGLNIREAHAFNTSDGFSLDVFVVDQFQTEPGVNLEQLLGQRLAQMPPPPALQPPGRVPLLQPQAQIHPQPQAGPSSMLLPPMQQSAQPSQQQPAWGRLPEDPMPNLDMFAQQQGYTRPASPAVDDWEIDIGQLQIDAKVASGAFSNLYRGSYCGQEVAVKILKDVADDTAQYQEFLQEVSIMRKVRHKNIVQFIGACTRKPNLCIVFEFMQGGSLYDYIRREGPLRLSQVLRVAVEVSRGMDYLHQRKIIHRDLKAANLLMDDHGVVKIADFGVARIIENTGHMTAETGTYRWMAPEVIEHKPYDEKADVFSFAVVLWELLTCKVPYSDMTPLQAAVGVVQKGLRPGIPPNCPPALADLLVASWQQSPTARPSFRELTPRLQAMLEAAREEEARQQAVAAMAAKNASAGGGLLAKLRGK